MKQLFLIPLLACVTGCLHAQKQTIKDKFTREVSRATGDLNADNLSDLALVTQDTLDEKASYRLQIFFATPNEQQKQVVSTESAIEPQYPEGRDGYATGNGFSDITIVNGVLSINSELLRGHFEYKFRYQNNRFELIEYTETSSDGRAVLTTTDFNLSTGLRLETRERYDTDKQLGSTRKKVLITPLPDLQHFLPGSSEFY